MIASCRRRVGGARMWAGLHFSRPAFSVGLIAAPTDSKNKTAARVSSAAGVFSVHSGSTRLATLPCPTASHQRVAPPSEFARGARTHMHRPNGKEVRFPSDGAAVRGSAPNDCGKAGGARRGGAEDTFLLRFPNKTANIAKRVGNRRRSKGRQSRAKPPPKFH